MLHNNNIDNNNNNYNNNYNKASLYTAPQSKKSLAACSYEKNHFIFIQKQRALSCIKARLNRLTFWNTQ